MHYSTAASIQNESPILVTAGNIRIMRRVIIVPTINSGMFNIKGTFEITVQISLKTISLGAIKFLPSVRLARGSARANKSSLNEYNFVILVIM